MPQEVINDYFIYLERLPAIEGLLYYANAFLLFIVATIIIKATFKFFSMFF